MRPSFIELGKALALALALADTAWAADGATPGAVCQMALSSAAALADRFAQGDPGLTYQDATDLAWMAMPEYRETLAMRGCAQMIPRFEALAMSGLRSGRVDVRALLRQACRAGTEPLDDNAQAAREAMREQGLAGLKMLGDDASACVAPAVPAARAAGR